MRVTAVLVSHDGARWLPTVLAALDASTALPDRIVAADTGSGDTSVALLEQALGPGVLRLAADTGYPDAVRAALATVSPEGPDDWVWLLHDDSAPAPDCLAGLVAAAGRANDDVAAIGPKLREWPSLRRLLEVGVTISGTGRRETGLEPGEYDQGQLEETRRVLAVNTAGMLVRRDALERIDLDPALPVFGNDLDFGWRLARAGLASVVTPAAVMFHAEAAHRGVRRGLLAERPRRDERAAAIRTLLVNSSVAMVPVRAVRLLVGGLLRALAFLLIRAPGEARDEVAALARVYAHPARIWSARRVRRRTATVPHREVRPLLAPFWVPYRHGLDFVGDLTMALVHAARERAGVAGETAGPAPRLLRSPGLWVGVLGTCLALVATRSVLSGGPLHGGALLTAPDGVGHWWSTWAASWHWLGVGSAAAGPAYLLPLALVGTVLLGHAGWVVSLLFVLAVPLSALGALRLARRVTSGTWSPIWGAAAYGLLPVVSGAVSQGRVGTVAGAVLLPWAAASALGLVAAGQERRWRAAWRTAIAVGLLAAFVPVAWLVSLPLLLVARFLGEHRPRWRELAVAAGVPLLLLAPWLADALPNPGLWLVEAGRAASVPVHPGLFDVFAGRAGGPGSADAWWGVGVPLAGLVALLRTDTRARVLRVWLVVLVAAVGVAVSARITVGLPGVPDPFRAWPGFLMLLVQGGLVLAAVIAADGAVAVVSRARFSWRQPVAAVALVAALVAPVAGVVWWVGNATQGPLERSAVADVPAYMSELAQGRHTGAVLVLSGSDREVDYRVLRNGSLRLGDDGVLAVTPPDTRLTGLVGDLLAADDAADAARQLAGYGIAYVYAPAPVNDQVSGALDATNGLASASAAPERDARAWRVVQRPDLSAIHADPSAVHPWLLVLQLLTVLTCIVLALPERRVS